MVRSSRGQPADNLLDALMKMRDEQRQDLKTAIKVVKGDSLPVEKNRMGLYRWYMHPLMHDRAFRALLYWLQEIPPGGCSGKQRHQGNRVHFVLEGRGYTVVDGVKHDWEAWDVIMLPLKPEGVAFQHFNADPNNWAKLVTAEPNLVDPLGVDLGVNFEQLEDAPGYKPS